MYYMTNVRSNVLVARAIKSLTMMRLADGGRSRTNRVTSFSTLPFGFVQKTSVRPADPKPNPSYIQDDKDVVLENIKSCTSHGDVFKLIADQNNLFNQKHLLECLKAIFEMHRKNPKIPIANISMHPSFERICIGLKKHCKTMDPNEVIVSLKILSYFGVKGTSVVFQHLLQIIRQNINHMSLSNITFLDFLLRKNEESPLADALRLALPLVFQLQLANQMDPENINQLADLLKFTSRNNVLEKYKNNIFTCLVLRLDDIDYKLARGIFYSLVEMDISWDNVSSSQRKILNHCLNLIGDNINYVPEVDVIGILNNLKDNFVAKGEPFYHKNFLTAASFYIINNKKKLEDAVGVSKILTRMGHTHYELCNYMAELIASNPDSLKNSSQFALLTFIGSLSNANYKPTHWDKIKHTVLQHPMMSSQKTDLPWMKLALDLAVLDLYDDRLLNRVFSEEFLDVFLSRRNNFFDHIQLLNLYNAVRIFHPSYEGVLPPESVLRVARGLNVGRSVDATLKAALEHGFGDPQYVIATVEMPGGLFADFVVHFQGGKDPMVFPKSNNTQAVLYESLNIKNNQHTVCILNFHKGCYSLNCERLRGTFNLLVKCLEAQKYQVVALPLDTWKHMPSKEKIPYLIREISVKIGNLDNNLHMPQAL